MESKDTKGCGIANIAWNFQSPQQPDLLVKEKSFSESCRAFSNVKSRSQKQKRGSLSDLEINRCESAKSVEMGTKGSSHIDSCSIDCTKENPDNSRQLSSVSSTSGNSELKKEICTDGTSEVSTHLHRLSGRECPKDGEGSAHFPTGTGLTPNVFMKSAFSSEDRQTLSKDTKELVCGLMRQNWLDSGEDRSKSVFMTTYNSKELKAESSSSNSMRGILSASSHDAFQETSLDAKSCKTDKSSGSDVSTRTDFKNCLEESAVRSSAFSLERNARECNPSENTDKVKKRECDNLERMTADSNTATMEITEVQKFHMPEEKSSELDVVKPCYEQNNATEAAQKVARKVELEVGVNKEASGSCSSVQERSGEDVQLSSVDSAVSIKDSMVNTGRKKYQRFCSSKDEVDPKTTIRNEELCLEIKDPSQGLGPLKKLEAKDCLPELQLTTNLEDMTSNSHPMFARFDLNENILPNEMGHSNQTAKEISLLKPIPMVAKCGVPLCLPKPHFHLDGEAGGWKGSATTSAFRPTSLPNRVKRLKASSEMNNKHGSKCALFNGIDLNIVAEAGECDMESMPMKCTQGLSSFPSRGSSVGTSSKRGEKFIIDLNCTGENEESCCQVSSPQSVWRCSGRDFDLNNNPTSADACNEAHQPGQRSMTLGGRSFDDSQVTSMRDGRRTESNVMEPSYRADVNPMHNYSNGHAASFLMTCPRMLSPFKPLQSVVPLHQSPNHAGLLPSPHQVPSNHALFINTNNCLSSAVYPPGVIPHIIDPRRTTACPPMLGASGMPGFSGPPQLMQVPSGPGSTDFAVIRPIPNLNGWTTTLEGGRWGGNGRQQFIPNNNAATEDQMRYFQQPAVSAAPIKREPQWGWDSNQLGFEQHLTDS